MCGLTAYNGLKPADPDKLKIIAIFNETRGKHSCGIFSGGKLGYGHEGNKLEYISDYLQKNEVVINKDWRNVMIHTRAATIGAKTLEGCHPFEYKRGNKRFFFMHNGTITNWKDLVKEADLVPEDYISDSKGMGAIVFKEGNCKVFQKYKGAGAFIFCDNQDKNTMWVYRGSAGDKEERPLFCWFDKKNQGIYISSLLTPLKIISGGDEVKYFTGNTLHKITNGVIVESTKLSRDEKLHEYYKPVNFHQPYHRNQAFGYGGENAWDSDFDNGIFTVEADKFFNQSTSQGTKVVWSKGRYWRNGHLLSGVFEISSIQHLTLPKKSDLLPNETVSEYYFLEGVMLTDKAAYEQLRGDMLKGNFPYLYPLCNAGLFKIAFTLEPYQTTFDTCYASRLMNKVCMFYNNKTFKIPLTNATMRINSYGEIGEITFLVEGSPKTNENNSNVKNLEPKGQLSLPIGIKKAEVDEVKGEQAPKYRFKRALADNFGVNEKSTLQDLHGFFTTAYPEVKVGVIRGIVVNAINKPDIKDIVGYIAVNIEWGIDNQPEVTLKTPQEENPFFNEQDTEEPVEENSFEEVIRQGFEDLGLPYPEDDEEEDDVVEMIKDFYEDFDNFIKDTEVQIKDLKKQAKELGVVDSDIDYLFNYLQPLFDTKENAESSREKEDRELGDDSERGPSCSC